MPKRVPDDRFREWLEVGFDATEIAELLRWPVEHVQIRLDKLNAPAREEAAQQSRLELARASAGKRPRPPESLFASKGPPFLVAPELWDWMLATFVVEGAALHNPLHRHLRRAQIGVLWAADENVSKERRILGQAQRPFPRGDKWAKALAAWQLHTLFGFDPEFIITLNARYALECDDWQWCALCEHEMLHCAQKRDEFGCPILSDETGKPLYTIQDHDVGQFNNIAERYGARAAGVEEMVKAALRGPTIADAAIVGACGTCLR